MAITTEESALEVDSALERVATLFKRSPAMILTEGDLKCSLYSELKPYFGTPRPTADAHIQGMALHSELSWFDRSGELRLRPDITILDTGNLSILHGIGEGISLPSKGAHFIGSAFLIEFKFWHEKSPIPSTKVSEIRNDLLKLQEIASRNNDAAAGFKILGRIVLFSRYPHYSRELDRLVEANEGGNIQMKVVTSGLLPEPSSRELWGSDDPLG